MLSLWFLDFNALFWLQFAPTQHQYSGKESIFGGLFFLQVVQSSELHGADGAFVTPSEHLSA